MEAPVGVAMESDANGKTWISSFAGSGGPLEQAGMRLHDRMLSVNGVDVTGAKHAASLLKSAEGNFEVTVERKQ